MLRAILLMLMHKADIEQAASLKDDFPEKECVWYTEGGFLQ